MAARPTAGGIILPGIQGTVFQDTDLGGAPSAGEGVSGATLRLYQDDGDGIFEPGRRGQSDWPGLRHGCRRRYAFETLDPNASYFVQRGALDLGGTSSAGGRERSADAGRNQFADRCVRQQSGGEGESARCRWRPRPSTIRCRMSWATNETCTCGWWAGSGEVELRSNAFGVAVLQYDNTSGVVGQAIITWDGVDMSASPIPSLGLGDLDLTQGGVNEGLVLRSGNRCDGFQRKATSADFRREQYRVLRGLGDFSRDRRHGHGDDLPAVQRFRRTRLADRRSTRSR